MPLDIPTLMVCDGDVAIFIGLALLFYFRFNKTYPGFGFWIVGSFFSATAYLVLFLRGPQPGWISILSVDLAFILAAVFRLDGMMRYIRETELRKGWYVFAAGAMAGVSSYFYFIDNSIVLRNLVLSAGIFIVAIFIAREMISFTAGPKRLFYYLAALINILIAFEIVISAMFFCFHALSGKPGYSNFLPFHQLIVIFYEVSWCILFIMINGKRLENELNDYREKLQNSLDELTTAMAEIKTLTGLLPICSICKNIRDDKGYWNRIESYISTHSDARFSHSICPECARQHYPDLKILDELE
jgi:hypothetical protein